ncbi:MAG: branched-chain amino acid ABC transporter permease [Deltaproteobacteria bacterium]
MTFFLQLIVTGFAQGMVYALVAIGFVIILKCSEVFNIAQGHFVLIGGYLGYTFLVPLGLPIWAALLASIGVAIGMGLLIERLMLRPMIGQPVLAVVMMTILFRYTKIGLAMRATAEDLQVVQSVGIKATTVYAASWIIASVVGVIGGILLGGVSGANMDLALIGLKAFAVVLLGGVNSIGGAIVAGIILGMLENVAAGYLDPLLPGGGLAQVFPFFVMIIVLVFRPHGLFGLAHIERI